MPWGTWRLLVSLVISSRHCWHLTINGRMKMGGFFATGTGSKFGSPGAYQYHLYSQTVFVWAFILHYFTDNHDYLILNWIDKCNINNKSTIGWRKQVHRSTRYRKEGPTSFTAVSHLDIIISNPNIITQTYLHSRDWNTWSRVFGWDFWPTGDIK